MCGEKKILEKHQKISKYYENDCRIKFFVTTVNGLEALVVVTKKSILAPTVVLQSFAKDVGKIAQVKKNL